MRTHVVTFMCYETKALRKIGILECFFVCLFFCEGEQVRYVAAILGCFRTTVIDEFIDHG